MNENRKKFFLMNIILAVMPLADIFYLIPSRITSGGLYGLAIVLMQAFGLGAHSEKAVSLIALILSSPLLVYAYFNFNKKYFNITLYSTLALPIYMFLISLYLDHFGYIVHEGSLVVATILGSLIQGFGVGLMMALGGSTGGIDIVAKIVNRYFPKISLGLGVAIANLVIVAVASIMFGIDRGIAAIVSIVLTGWFIDLGIWIGYKLNRIIFKKEINHEIK